MSLKDLNPEDYPKIKDHEKLLREHLKDEIENTGLNIDMEATKNSEYVYKKFPLPQLNEDGKKEVIHALVPKKDLEGWDGSLNEEGLPDLPIAVEKCLYLCCKEVTD